MGSGTTRGVITASFVASVVEFVETLTIVLAMGMTRDWRSALAGSAAALVGVTVDVRRSAVRPTDPDSPPRRDRSSM